MPEEWENIIPEEEWTELAKEAAELKVCDDETIEDAEESIRGFGTVAVALFAKKLEKLQNQRSKILFRGDGKIQ